MTSEKLHDALNLLPADLVAGTDALRTKPKKPQVHWQRWAAMAACLAVVLLGGYHGSPVSLAAWVPPKPPQPWINSRCSSPKRPTGRTPRRRAPLPLSEKRRRPSGR